VKSDALNQLVRKSEQRRLELRVSKGKEYTRGEVDVLSNFKRIAKALEGVTIMKENGAAIVWLVYFHKHFDAIVSFIKNCQTFSGESIEGRVDDAHVYLDLFYGIVKEIQDGRAAKSHEEAAEKKSSCKSGCTKPCEVCDHDSGAQARKRAACVAEVGETVTAVLEEAHREGRRHREMGCPLC